MTAALAGPPAFTWRWLRFDALTTDDLYDVLVLRSEIFVVEQACVFLDADGADRASFHLLGAVGDGSDARLGAYLRFIDAGVKYPEPSIGRVVVAPPLRGLGCGRVLVEEGLARARATGSTADIVIGAQRHLADFYRSLGFVAEGPPYDEDGIEHVKMRKTT